MKIVIDTNVIISAALGSQTCSKVILWAMNNAQIIEPNIVSIELEHFCKKLITNQIIENNIKQIEPGKILNISTDKPDNHFLSLSLEEDAIFITGDKLALEFAKANNIKAASPSDFIKRIK